MMNDIALAIIKQLQADEVLRQYVETWTIEEGTKPGKHITVSSGCYKCEFAEYDADQDAVLAVYNVYVALPADRRPDLSGMAEFLAENIRFALTEDPTIGGKVATSFVRGIEYHTIFDRSEAVGATIFVEISEFVDRRRPKDIPTVATVKTDIDYI